MKTSKKYIIYTAIMFVIFAVYLLLIKTVDIGIAGTSQTSVGFSHINNWFFGLSKDIDIIDTISDIILLLSILIAACFALVGFVQFIKRKNIKHVDKEIFLSGLAYIILICSYIFFELVVVNYRPKLIEGELEASFPSSHVMLVMGIILTTLLFLDKYITNKKLLLSLKITGYSLCVLIVVFRSITGVHWLTDIIGGVILSLAVVMLILTLKKIWIKNDIDKKD